MKYNKNTQYSMIKFLRYRNQAPAECRRTYMSLQAIAKFLNCSMAQVHRRCKEIIADAKAETQKAGNQQIVSSYFDQYKVVDKHVFSEEQIQYLLSERTLHEWSVKSMSERV